MRKLIVITSVLFVAVIVAAILYFTSLSHNNRTQNSSLTAIPADAAFLVSFQNEKSFYNIFNDFEIFEAIVGKETQHEWNYLNKQLLRAPNLAELTNKQTLYFSFHPTKDHINWLLTVPFKNRLKSDELFELLKKNTNDIATITPDTAIQSLYRIKFNDLSKPFFVALKPEAAFLGHEKDLVAKVLDNNSPHLSEHFLDELAQNGHKNDNAIFNLHLNHSELFKFVSGLSKVKAGNNIQLLEGLKGMSSLNMNFKSDALMFSGLSTLDQTATTGNYISLYTHQTAVEGELKKMLPANTAAYAAFSFSNYQNLHRELVGLLNKRKQLQRFKDQFALIHSSKKISIDSVLLSQWDNEFASLELNTRESIGLVKLKDSADFLKVISPISTGVTNDIRRFDNSNLLYYSFGDPMLLFQRPYFTVVDRYLICANTISVLQQYRKQYDEKQLLINTIPYIEFSRLQSNKANITFFIENEQARQNLNRTLKSTFQRAYADTTHFNFRDFYAFSYQLSGYNGNFYSNLSAKYSSKEKTSIMPEWKADLSSEINYPPSVWKFNDTTNFIITQDKSNRLYAFSTTGKELWRTGLSSEILGEIQQLPDQSLVFNTADRLYRLTTDGSPVQGFPIALPYQASYGLTLFSGDQQDTKIFIPAKQQILAFDENGKELKEWKNKTVTGTIVYNLKTALLDDYRYVIALTDQGRYYLFNHTGSLVSTMEHQPASRFNNTFGIEITSGNPETSRMITTDTSGVLWSTSFDKDKKEVRTSLGKWTENHYFNTKNIQGDSIPELIFTDKNQLFVYASQDSTLLFNQTFTNEISDKPLFFPVRNNYFTIGIATEAKLLYVIDDDGNIVKGFPMEGYPAFYYGKLNNDGHIYALISKDGHTLSAYRLD
ncbi:hypothetical protein GCM10023231_28210 [Olivibacter ginsenosidimutans]|uniref:PQQ-like beta-propeller repeat protein n=1 Tax=Olivibacter ginsenosidimutans TaxID=1176537 RepID=A0ABP9BRH8_9SPHI